MSHSFRRDALDGFFHRFPEALQKVPGQKRNVLAPITQRRHQDGNHTEAVIEVFAESAFCNLFFKVFVRGRDDANVHIRFFSTADGANFTFLKDAIELHLHGEAHVSDLVHEECATMGRLEEALAILIGARESSLHVTEKLGLQKGFRERTAVDGDKWSLRSPAVFMNSAGNEFPTGAALTCNKNAAGLRSDRLDHVENGAHLRTLADNIVQTSEPPDFTAQESSFLVPFQVLGDFMDAKAQLSDQSHT